MDTLKELPTKKLGGFTETDSEIQFLENLFNEDCKCQASHEESTCSSEVTHKASHSVCGHPPKLVCLNAAKWGYEYAALRRCGYCNRMGNYVMASDCWIITPI